MWMAECTCKASQGVRSLRVKMDRGGQGSVFYALWYFDFISRIIPKEEVNRMSDVLERVTRIVIDRLGADEAEVTLEASFKDDLGADSLDVVELVMELEDEFDMEISDEDAERITTVGEVVKYIQSHT